MNIALFGGTFDPIHRGHLTVARAAAAAFDLKQVRFIPADIPPHKQKTPITSFYHRYAMVSLALAVLLAILVYGMPLGQTLLAGTEGAAFGFFPILWIVINAIWVYQMTVETGHFDVLRRSFARVSDDQRLKLEGSLETEYYAKQTNSGGPIKVIGIVVAFIMAIGSIFAAMNTMYAAVAYRSREIATLRVIGFSRPSILTSFMLESLLLSLLGATLGIILMLPFNGMTTGTQNQVTFSEVVFSLQMTPAVVMSAVIFALIMGVVGGFAPAWHASRRDILSALRD